MIKLGKYPSISLQNSEFSLFIKFVTFDYSLVDKVKSLPTRKYIPDQKVWEVPLSDIDRVVKTFGIDNLECFTEIPEFDEYINYKQALKVGKKTIAELKEYYKNLQCEIPYVFKTKPRGHQIESFNLALHQDSMFITDVMGLGKTKQAIDIMDYRETIGKVHKVLILCGVNSIKYNWINEIETHSFNKGIVIDGTKPKRLEKLRNCDDYFYVIINAESIRSKIDDDGNEYDADIIQYLEYAFDEGIFDAVIVDECHKFNNAKSQQGGNLRRLNCKSKIALSGTPITKRIEKIWNILNWFGVIQESYWNFVKRYCVLGGFSGYDVIGYQNTTELHERIDRVQVRRTKDILDLPELTHQNLYVDFTPSQLKEYKLIKAGIMIDLETQEVNLISPMTASLRLRQFTELCKLKAVAETAREIVENGGQCIIFSFYKENLYTLHSELKNFGSVLLTGDLTTKERQDSVDAFQRGEYKIAIGTIQALGTGFTLTKAEYVIYLTKSWVNGDNEQATDRAHRIGTEKNVTVITTLVKNSIDERVEEVLENDKIYIDRVVDGKIVFKRSNKDLLKFLLEV